MSDSRYSRALTIHPLRGSTEGAGTTSPSFPDDNQQITPNAPTTRIEAPPALELAHIQFKWVTLQKVLQRPIHLHPFSEKIGQVYSVSALPAGSSFRFLFFAPPQVLHPEPLFVAFFAVEHVSQTTPAGLQKAGSSPLIGEGTRPSD